ncbi:uncharacterized protein LOC126733752 [Anthonomus grandis grandis]|uniref:uncharacterized protein LOC126733752 n=1 Tax=Anthonomus grandis grandis TaxID=2921223 RepID=UPI002166AC56|nr:uncharacterized protein LOC126733752 [Anthonomus grandis grandis]
MEDLKQENWPSESPIFNENQLLLLANHPIEEPHSPPVKLEEIIENSERFPIKFPIETVRCQFLRQKKIPEATLEFNINSVYPVLHETALSLYVQFLSHKKRFGSKIERNLYKEFTVEQLVERLLVKQAVYFLGKSDLYLLINGRDGAHNWEKIGKDDVSSPETLEDCLSYDEIKLSALLSVSSYTYFINDGNRYNEGKYCANRSKIEDSGIIIGLIGARLEKPMVMEYQDVVVSKEQNTQENGYGNTFIPTLQSIFTNFYGEPCLTYEQLKPNFNNKKKYTKLSETVYFDNEIYERRMSLSIDTLLLEANFRAKEAGKMAFVHVVGIGLGVWRISTHQGVVFREAFAKRIQYLGKTNNLNHVSDIRIANHGGVTSCGPYKDQDVVMLEGHPCGGIKIHINGQHPHEKLIEEHQGKLLVVSYAWDGNALPGNEFWRGSLDGSGDPAAASSTQIAELHNAHINPKVSAKSLMIATLNGLVPFRQYVKQCESLQKSTEKSQS